MNVLLGMSGGIDSSVAAILLQQQGYHVIGVTLRLGSQTDGIESTTIPSYITEAQDLASQLGIEHIVVDVRQEFNDLVISYFKNEYLAGKTPNPCAKCNVVLKWKTLNELAKQKGCTYIATGHYVNKTTYKSKFYISKGLDPDKEQSFFLWGLSAEILQKALFPLGKLSKSEVREIAKNKGFHSLNSKKESTGVCFIAGNNYQSFLEKAFAETNELPSEGLFVDKNGASLGKHKGFPFYTVGQRRGLGLEPTEPYYVTKIFPETNTIELGQRNDLYQNEMWVENYNIINKSDFETEVITRIRYRKQSAISRVEFINEKLLKVSFIEPEWSIAPGQTAAFYAEDRLLGGGFIKG
jgi:tRNA-specific 2-thiouridylase